MCRIKHVPFKDPGMENKGWKKASKDRENKLKPTLFSDPTPSPSSLPSSVNVLVMGPFLLKTEHLTFTVLDLASPKVSFSFSF